MEIFSRVSKVIQARLGFTQLRFVIGKENSRHPLNQSDAKLKTIATLIFAFSRASRGLFCFNFESSLASVDINLCFDWSLV